MKGKFLLARQMNNQTREYVSRMLVTTVLALGCLGLPAAPASVTVTIDAQPLNSGTVDPKLFGNFIELLEDVVPGMWAELLNDRSVEGVLPAANWCYYDGSPDICDRTWDTNATWSLVGEHPFNGARCAKLNGGVQPATLTQSRLSARKGMGYVFSGHLRAEPGVKASVHLKFLLPSGEWLTLASADLPALSSTWQKVSVTMNSSGETDRAVFELRATGKGSLWADKLSLMPADNLNGWRRDVVEVVKAMRPAVIRFGGSCVDPGRYRWKENTGDRDSRTPWPNHPWGRLDPADVGIDEFCQFCELAGAEPLVCVSFSDGAQNAGDLVEYCNGDSRTTWGSRRAANGHPAPYQVKYWQVGNEISGANPDYLRDIPAFISKIKLADPVAQIMTSFPDQELLNRVGKDVAWVCPHHYTADLAACERDFNQISGMLERTPGCSGLKIGVTEWNTDAGSWGLGRGKFATLDVALMNARYLNLLMRHCDRVKIACRSNLANSYCGAVIETSPTGTGVLKHPSYYVMALYANRALPQPLRLETSGNRLDLFACASQDKNSVVLFAVNPKPEPVALSVGFRGFAGSLHLGKAEAVCDTLNAGQPDIMNHWESPERVKIVPLPLNETVAVPSLSATALEYGQN
jgi:alpha-L-arabinofuranosidase